MNPLKKLKELEERHERLVRGHAEAWKLLTQIGVCSRCGCLFKKAQLGIWDLLVDITPFSTGVCNGCRPGAEQERVAVEWAKKNVKTVNAMAVKEAKKGSKK